MLDDINALAASRLADEYRGVLSFNDLRYQFRQELDYVAATMNAAPSALSESNSQPADWEALAYFNM